MSDPTRADLLATLAELGAFLPSFRFGQLIATLAIQVRDTESSSIWEMEDDELLAATRELLANRRAAASGTAVPLIHQPLSALDAPLADKAQ